ncbi:MAG: gliding motility-associated C-terminal domain-containing protein [Saprospiraceae bacterium]
MGRILLLLIFLFVVNLEGDLTGQCMPARSDDCDGANVLCGLTAMNGYTCKNADYPNMNGPPSLCPGWGPPTNIGWWAFVTSGGNVCITVTYNNCTFPPPGGTNGIQLGIYEDCSYSNLLICDATCPGPSGTKTICANLAACKTYYFFVDGCNGDVCDFTLQTTGGAAPSLDPIGKINNDADQKIEVCKGACKVKFNVKAQKAGCEAMYKWELDGVDQGVNSNNISLDFPDEGSFVLCATAIIGTSSSICDKSGPECATITVKKLDDKKGGPYHICPEKIPYSWHGETIDMSGMYRKEFRDANCCYYDSVVEFIIQPVPTPPDYYYIGCGPQDAFKDPITNKVYNNCESQTLISLPGSTIPYGCDSTYYLSAIFLRFNTFFLERCADQMIEISPRILNQTSSCGGGETFNYSYRWYLRTDQLKKTIGTDEKVTVDKKDEYCLELSVETKLGTLTKICKFDFCETLNEDDFMLHQTRPYGDTIVCANSISRYAVDTNLSKNIKTHYWIVTNGTILTSNPGDTGIIDIKWSSLPGKGKICYSYSNDCGTSPDSCFEVVINDAPVVSAGPDTSICGSIINLQGVPYNGGVWRTIKGPGPAIFTDSTFAKTTVKSDSSGLYRFVWLENNGNCPTTDTVEVQFNASPVKGSESIICGGNNKDYKIRFQVSGGSSPYLILKGSGSIDISGVYTSDPIPNLIKDTIIIADANGCSFTFIHDYECKCTNQIGSLDTTSQSLCTADLYILKYDSSNQRLDLSPADTIIFFVYTDPNDPLGSLVFELNTTTLSYSTKLNYNKTYYIGAYLGRKNNRGGIDVNQGCVRITNKGTPFEFFEQPSPFAGADTSICGNSIMLMASGVHVSTTFRWSVINGGPVILSLPDSSKTNAGIQGSYGTYLFRFEENNQGICSTSDDVEVTFDEVPELLQIDKQCVDLNPPGKFVVNANIHSGTPPYQIISGGGKIAGGQWLSDTLNSLDVFNIEIIDSNGCHSTLISDTYNCNCGIIDAGKLDSTPTSLCIDQCARITNLINEQITAGEDVAMYVLHNGFFKNALDTFYSSADKICFDPSKMKSGPNNIYYISRIVGDDKNPKDGIVDATDACLRVSNNQPVYWLPYPKVYAGLDTTVCDLDFLLSGSSDVGSTRWSLLSGPGNAQISNSSMAQTLVSVSQFGDYQFVLLGDNNGCDQSDTILVRFVDAPSFSGVTTIECDTATAEFYRILIKLTGGDVISRQISASTDNNKTLNGSFDSPTKNGWTSDWISNGSTFKLKVYDQYHCNEDSLSGMNQCPCITVIGKLNTQSLHLCEGQNAVVPYDATTARPDANDKTWFVLYDGSPTDPVNGNFISTGTNPVIPYDANRIQLNKKYYIAVFAGNSNTQGNGPSLTDRCLDYTVMEITWHARPTALILAPDKIQCQQKVVTLDGSSSLSGSGTPLQFAWQTTNGRFTDPGQSKTSLIHCDRAGDYTLIVTDSLTGCMTSVTKNIGWDTLAPLINTIPPLKLTCDLKVIDLSAAGSSFGSQFSPQWSGPGITGPANDYITKATKSGIYHFVLTNTDNGCVDSALVKVDEDRMPPVSRIQQIGLLTCGNASVTLDGSGSTASSGNIASYLWNSILGNISTGQGTSRVIINKPGGVFTLTIKDAINGCVDLDTIQVNELPNPLRDMLIEFVNPGCFGDMNGSISVRSVVDSLNQPVPGLDFSIDGSSFSKNSDFNNRGKGQYTITARDANGCRISKGVTLAEPAKLAISVVRQKVVNQGDIVHLDSMLLSLSGGTTKNGQYKDTLWFNTDDQADWENYLTYEADTTREFVITGIDQSDCEIKGTVTILVRIIREVWWPTIFSPNGDGVNDFFNVYGKRIKTVRSISIFDRWGNRVYTNSNLEPGNSQSNQGWDGTFKEERALPGVYTFYAEIEYDGSLHTEVIAGNVTLIR